MLSICRILLGWTFAIVLFGAFLKLIDKFEHSHTFEEQGEIINRRAVLCFVVSCVTFGVFGYYDFMHSPHFNVDSLAIVYIGARVLGTALPQIIARLTLYRLGVQDVAQFFFAPIGGIFLSGEILEILLPK